MWISILLSIGAVAAFVSEEDRKSFASIRSFQSSSV